MLTIEKKVYSFNHMESSQSHSLLLYKRNCGYRFDSFVRRYRNSIKKKKEREIIKLSDHHLIINFSSIRCPFFFSLDNFWNRGESHEKFNNPDVSEAFGEIQKEDTVFWHHDIRGPKTKEKSTNPRCLCHSCCTYLQQPEKKKKESFSGVL